MRLVEATRGDRDRGRSPPHEADGAAGQHQPRATDRARRAGRGAQSRPARDGGGRRLRRGAGARHRASAAQHGQRRLHAAHRLRLARGVRDSVHRHLRPDHGLRRRQPDQRDQSRRAVVAETGGPPRRADRRSSTRRSYWTPKIASLGRNDGGGWRRPTPVAAGIPASAACRRCRAPAPTPWASAGGRGARAAARNSRAPRRASCRARRTVR